MIDHEKVRQNLDLYRQAINDKRLPLDLDNWLAVLAEHNHLKAEVDALRAQRNKLSDAVAFLPKGDGAARGREQIIEQGRALGQTLGAAEERLRQVAKTLHELDALMPGLPQDEVPPGFCDDDNLELRRVGEVVVGAADAPFKDHLELMQMHSMVDLGLRDLAGSRAYALTGLGALLELAVLRMAFEFVCARGFSPVLPPLMVKADAMFGTGYFPLGEENAYELERDGLFLTGTAEVGIVAMMAQRLFAGGELPLRLVGMSPCFRREAGSAGRDVRGLYRVHQFQKVEQVVFCADDAELIEAEHLALLKNAEDILQALELPYRVVRVCRGEMGLGQVLKHDIETWMPSRKGYGETHSCSTFGDFQARRLNIRYRDGAAKRYVCTLNNTAIASPRILIALLENHQRKDGTIYVPPALRPYLGGIEECIT
jgi:seryl-tRNA synthetase